MMIRVEGKGTEEMLLKKLGTKSLRAMFTRLQSSIFQSFQQQNTSPHPSKILHKTTNIKQSVALSRKTWRDRKHDSLSFPFP